MSDPLNDWETLQTEWQAYQPDIQQIKKKVSWVTWRMGAVLLIDVVILLAYIPFLIYFVASDESGWIVDGWHYFIGLLLVYGVYLDFKIRLPIFRSQGDSTKAVLELYLKRTEAGIAIGRIGKNFSWVLLVAFSLWWLANFFLFPENEKIARWQFGLFGIVWISAFVIMCRWYQQRKEKEFIKLKALWRDYLD
jgi:hypothetical protein